MGVGTRTSLRLDLGNAEEGSGSRRLTNADLPPDNFQPKP